ncbi:MAG: hypothetical protein QMD03_08860 [Syntrophales bacterium]|nr:hypothetical protein [Syntrophales bacterium]
MFESIWFNLRRVWVVFLLGIVTNCCPCFRRAGPLLGQDNRYVYQDLLSLDEDEFRQYVEKGIIA